MKLQVDHVVPEALGGPSVPENLRTLCADCNGGKSATPPDAAIVAQVGADAIRWAEAQKVASARMLADLEQRARNHAEFDAAWSGWIFGENQERLPRDGDWTGTVDRLLAAGLPMAVLIDCIGQAMRNSTIPPDSTFRYMCGMAWNRVKDLHRATADVVAGVPQDVVQPSHEHGRRELAEEILEWSLEGREALLEAAKNEAAEDGVGAPGEAELAARAAIISARWMWGEVHGRRSTAQGLLRSLPEGLRRRVLDRAESDVRSQSEDGQYTTEDVESWAVAVVGYEIKERFTEEDWSRESKGASAL